MLQAGNRGAAIGDAAIGDIDSQQYMRVDSVAQADSCPTEWRRFEASGPFDIGRASAVVARDADLTSDALAVSERSTGKRISAPIVAGRIPRDGGLGKARHAPHNLERALLRLRVGADWLATAPGQHRQNDKSPHASMDAQIGGVFK